MKQIRSLAVPIIALSCLPSVQGALLFYENFTGFTAGGASLNGQGGWVSALDTQKVQNSAFGSTGDATWDGTIINSTTSGGNFIARIGDAYGHIALAPSVTNSFVAGTTTWFSYVEYNGDGGANGRQNVAIGAAPLTGAVTSVNGQEMAGQGIGIATTSNNTPRAAYWTPTAGAANDEFADATSTIGSGRPIFVMAKINWSDTGNDVITVKRFAFSIPAGLTEADWNAITGEVSINGADLAQSTFNTLSFANRSAFLDDIRIASDFTSAVSGTTVIPEPSALILGCLGGLALLRRRR